MNLTWSLAVRVHCVFETSQRVGSVLLQKHHFFILPGVVVDFKSDSELVIEGNDTVTVFVVPIKPDGTAFPQC